MATDKNSHVAAGEVVDMVQPAGSGSVITPDILAAAVRQIAGQTQVTPPLGVASPYLKYAFEFFKLGTELSNFFTNLEPLPFTPETIRRSPTFPGIYVILRGDTVVYVGQSQNLHRRFGEHWKGTSSFALALKGKYRPNSYREFLGESFALAWREFDDVPYLSQLEHIIIAVFQPMFNREGASDHRQPKG